MLRTGADGPGSIYRDGGRGLGRAADFGQGRYAWWMVEGCGTGERVAGEGHER
jgi:hypothetical protein